jgi:uncharacterized membrane protein
MFERVTYADWHVIFPLAAFIVAAVFFVTMSWRALRMPRRQAERFARLPLEPDGRPLPPHE